MGLGRIACAVALLFAIACDTPAALDVNQRGAGQGRVQAHHAVGHRQLQCQQTWSARQSAPVMQSPQTRPTPVTGWQ